MGGGGSDRASPAQTRVENTGRDPGHVPIPRASTPPPRTQLAQQDDLMGGPLEFFLTHVCDNTHLLVYIIGSITKKLD
jgi:hypothetical protein